MQWKRPIIWGALCATVLSVSIYLYVQNSRCQISQGIEQPLTETSAAPHYPSKKLVRPVGSMAQQALTLGTLFAEYYLAIDRTDLAQLKVVGFSLAAFSHKLTKSETMNRQVNGVLSAAKVGEWAIADRELGGIMDAFRRELDKDTLVLASFGEWVRVTQSLCEQFDPHYSGNELEALFQPTTLARLETRFNALGPGFKNDPQLEKARTLLKEMKPLVEPGFGKDLKERVQAIGKITGAFVAEIRGSGR